ncbi:hypothetical protein MM1S1540310_4969 [Mycobacteroides abscessus subsp. bolletii 1S-154-0310]|uniref:Uncharacterized protein n=1 Tax=Mycobacteroides abscessus 1948 TaxID=1299323 RepID=A0A829QN74_9MYCO|nr:hypothetical protein MA6G0125R_4609 [Mycobacteroides abscessus 6G-0125-R]EIU51517.1 hypothetical protein MA6G0125S_0341 [Mycobacteroides abscessus 6G-0125-S]EIU56934.1 hypothetical protein MA6G0728S_1966 [Mycobacteroides abscessus 6G-0728-S]EIU58719.1 hypothetical protein MM1S1510930_5412 [Mycobacteroides abscessus subsp. bolletii 1S-151-0930]EIU72153.1 hypothetical protein MM1S1530915_4963 [Mycobacteroides abscessus subsp. bolletii 1S-153-0915]EIU72782.1 hypothetical protein MM1S1520914_06
MIIEVGPQHRLPDLGLGCRCLFGQSSFGQFEESAALVVAVSG